MPGVSGPAARTETVVEVPASSAVPPAGLRKVRSEVACAGSAGTDSVLVAASKVAVPAGSGNGSGLGLASVASRLLGRLSQLGRHPRSHAPRGNAHH